MLNKLVNSSWLIVNWKRKLFFFLSFLVLYLLLSLLNINPAFAIQIDKATFEGKDITLTYEPDPLTTASAPITITLEGEQPVFLKNRKYYFSLTRPGGELKECGIWSVFTYVGVGQVPLVGMDQRYRHMGEVVASDEKKLIVTWDPTSWLQWFDTKACPRSSGKWYFSLWTGTNPTPISDPAPDSKNIIINNSLFVVDTPGGSFPKIEAIKNPNYLNSTEKAQVKLVNGRKGETYYFIWQDGWTRDKTVTADFDGDRIIEFDKKGSDFPPGSNPTICLVRSVRSAFTFFIPRTTDCSSDPNRKVTFQIPTAPITETTNQCTAKISPLTTTNTDKFLVSVSGANITTIPPDKLLRADLINLADGNLTRLPASGQQIQLTDQNTFLINLGELMVGEYQVNVYPLNSLTAPPDGNTDPLVCSVPKITVSKSTKPAEDLLPNTQKLTLNYKCAPTGPFGTNPNTECSKASGLQCNPKTGSQIDIDNNNPGMMTAIGCVPTRPKAFVEGMLKFASFIVGGVALLLMILGALQMITTEGNPELIKAAQEKFYSAIIGLLIIIFSVLFLQVVGVDVLGLPGFS